MSATTLSRLDRLNRLFGRLEAQFLEEHAHTLWLCERARFASRLADLAGRRPDLVGAALALAATQRRVERAEAARDRLLVTLRRMGRVTAAIVQLRKEGRP